LFAETKPKKAERKKQKLQVEEDKMEDEEIAEPRRDRTC
jgi:hypothetical protein